MDVPRELIPKIFNNVPERFRHNCFVAKEYNYDTIKFSKDYMRMRAAYNNRDFEYAFEIACANGYINFVKNVIRYGVHGFNANLLLKSGLYTASRNGHKNVVKYLIQCGAGHYEKALIKAIRNRHFDTAKYIVSCINIVANYLDDYQFSIDLRFGDVFGIACDGGCIEIVEFLLAWAEVTTSETAFIKACTNNNLQLIKCISGYKECNVTKGLQAAYAAGSQEVINYLLKRTAYILPNTYFSDDN